MKTIVEFGIRGGACVDNLACGTITQGATFAAGIAHVFGAKGTREMPRGVIGPGPADKRYWQVSRACPSLAWQTATHYVSVSILDGVARGPASARLWRL